MFACLIRLAHNSVHHHHISHLCGATLHHSSYGNANASVAANVLPIISAFNLTRNDYYPLSRFWSSLLFENLELVLVAIINNCNVCLRFFSELMFTFKKKHAWCKHDHTHYMSYLLLPRFIIQAKAMPTPVPLPMFLHSLSIWLVINMTFCQGFSHHSCLRVQN